MNTSGLEISESGQLVGYTTNDENDGYVKLIVELGIHGANIKLTEDEEVIARDDLKLFEPSSCEANLYRFLPHEVIITCLRCNQNFRYRTKSGEFYFTHSDEYGYVEVSRILGMTAIMVSGPATAVTEETSHA